MQGDILLWENYFLDIEISVGISDLSGIHGKIVNLEHYIGNFFLLGKIKEVYRNKKVRMVAVEILCMSF